MPYDGEFAKHGILRDFENNTLITEMLSECDVRESEELNLPKSLLQIPRNQWKASQVFAIDGSHRPIKIRNGYPGASAGFLSVATVMIDMEKLAREVSNPSINPVTFSEVEKAYAITGALPSSNVVRRGMPDARSSFRYSFYKLLEKTKPIEGGESLLATYEAVISLKPPSDGLACPLGELCQHNKKHPNLSTGKCACGSYDVYPTDQLRIHERFYDNAPNGESIGEARSLMEHFTLLNYLRHIESVAESEPRFWEIFVSTGFVLDGPLAIFGHAAWLSERVQLELQRINAKVVKQTGKDMLVVGIEKSGQFFDHWLHLDEARSDNVAPKKSDFARRDQYDDILDSHFKTLDPLDRLRGRIEPQQVFLPDNQYIRANIARGDPETIHGISTYYGRPFLYKTKTSAMIVGMSPMLCEPHKDRKTALITQYPRLADTLDLLDALISMRYPNAVLPLMAAHAHAAIPVQMGDKMFDSLIRQHLGKSRNGK
jgi:hypothetical protein